MCGQRVSATTDLVGSVASCPSCDASIEIESPDTEELPAPPPLPTVRPDHYLLLVGAEQRGPYALSQLRTMWRSGSITADSLYWQEGFEEWAPISRISDSLDPPAPAAHPPALPRTTKQQAIVKTYTGSQSEATTAFQRDAAKMAAQGYVPTSQTWTPGEYGCGSFLVALLLCVVLIGILVFIYMLIVKPPGTLTVNYEFRGN